MNSLYIVLAVVIAVTNVKSLGALKVQVFYETLCSDSKAFITTQLNPTFSQLGSQRIQVELIAWGHASEKIDKNGNKTFTCQHGPDECYGNKVHACVNHLAIAVEESVHFAYCSELSHTPANKTVLQVCSQGAGIAWSKVEDCLASGKADELLSENGRKTAQVDAFDIPTIVFKDVYYPNKESVRKNFKQVVCRFVDCVY